MVRPPIVYLVSLVAGWALEAVWQLPFLADGLAVVLGPLLVVVAMALFARSVLTCRAAGTPVPDYKASVRRWL